MNSILLGFSLTAALVAWFFLDQSKSAIHEIQGLICALIAAVFFVGSTLQRPRASTETRTKRVIDAVATIGLGIFVAVVAVVLLVQIGKLHPFGPPAG